MLQMLAHQPVERGEGRLWVRSRLGGDERGGALYPSHVGITLGARPERAPVANRWQQACHDEGSPNPGDALIEEMHAEDGRISTLSLGDYKLPNIKDIPPLKTVLVQDQVGPVPFQGKSIGESSITPITAAIANALYDAVGVRICDLPITAEKVYRALQAQQGAGEQMPQQDWRSR